MCFVNSGFNLTSHYIAKTTSDAGVTETCILTTHTNQRGPHLNGNGNGNFNLRTATSIYLISVLRLEENVIILKLTSCK
jgi:hypothetical protein